MIAEPWEAAVAKHEIQKELQQKKPQRTVTVVTMEQRQLAELQQIHKLASWFCSLVFALLAGPILVLLALISLVAIWCILSFMGTNPVTVAAAGGTLFAFVAIVVAAAIWPYVVLFTPRE